MAPLRRLLHGLCASLVATVACSVPAAPQTARSEIASPTPMSIVAPSSTASPDLFTDVSLIASSGGDVYRRTPARWVHLASLCQEVEHLLIAPDGTALFATCFRMRESDGLHDLVLHDLRSGATRRLSGSDGLVTSGRPVWSPAGTAIAYVTADGCPSFAPGCRTRIAVLDIATATERTIPEGPIGELPWTTLGLSSYRETCASVVDCDRGPVSGTWLLTPSGWSHFSAHRLVSSDGRRSVLEDIREVEGRVRSVATIERLGTVERRLTPAGVPSSRPSRWSRMVASSVGDRTTRSAAARRLERSSCTTAVPGRARRRVRSRAPCWVGVRFYPRMAGSS